MDENPPHVVPDMSSDSQPSPQQVQLDEADGDIREAKIHFNLPGCPKKVLLDVQWRPTSRSGAFRVWTKVLFDDDTLEQAEQAIFLFNFPDKVQHLSLHPMPDPVQGGHTHVLHFDFMSPPTFVSPTKKLVSADPNSNETIKFFSNLVNLPTLDLPLNLATAATGSTTKMNLTVLEDMCKAFEDADGMHSVLSCLRLSTLYNGKGGFPTTPTQFPDANPPDYASSRKRPASHPTASRPRQRPRLDSQANSPRSHADQYQTGLDRLEELSRRIDTVAEQMESSRASTDARLTILDREPYGHSVTTAPDIDR
ncbi:hypothetical protein MKX07_008397 [Trichoderma sp. CBMAI-0711]|nr:hypothetical protein MKX07_008397 [Trichoderma sp. CBMAI-0711]